MDSSFIGLKNIADITKLTALSYSCYFFFRIGEAVFYDYPFTYINVDASSLFSVLIKTLLVLLIAYILIHVAIKSSRNAIGNTIIVFIGMIGVSVKLYLDTKNASELISIILFNFIVFFCLFSIASEVKKMSNIAIVESTKKNSIKIIGYAWVICFLIGNNYYAYVPDGLYQDKTGRVIVSPYNGKFIMKKCNSDGSISTYIEDMPVGELKSIDKDYFYRDFIRAKCNLNNIINR